MGVCASKRGGGKADTAAYKSTDDDDDSAADDEQQQVNAARSTGAHANAAGPDSSKASPAPLLSSRRCCQCHKLVLLGASNGGKTTVLKQLLAAFGARPLSDAERALYAPVLVANVVQGMSSLAALCIDADPALQLHNMTQTDPSADPAAARLLAASLQQVPAQLTPEDAKQLAALWTEPRIQAAFAKRRLATQPVSDSLPYLMSQIKQQGGQPADCCRSPPSCLLTCAFSVSACFLQLV